MLCAQCAKYVIYGTYVVVLLIINAHLASAHSVGYLLLNLTIILPICFCHEMCSTFYTGCLYPSALQTRFYHGNNGIKRYDEECGGSVVECLTRDQRVAGSCLTGGTALCPRA